MIELFIDAFNSGASFEEAVQQSGYPEEATFLLAKYWNLMVMDAAVQKAAEYFDHLLEVA